MNGKRSLTRWLALIALACTSALPLRAYAVLFVDGPISAVPGGTLSLEIGLDAALVANIDELTLLVQFDSGVLTGQDAVAGPLLGSGLFSANAATGFATHSFLATLTELGPGVLATWTFGVDPAAVPQTAMVVRATLQTFVIDNELTAELSSAPLTISVVPEPSVAGLLLAGLAGLGALRLLRKR